MGEVLDPRKHLNAAAFPDHPANHLDFLAGKLDRGIGVIGADQGDAPGRAGLHLLDVERVTDAHHMDALASALLALAEHRAQVITHGEKAWASITFAGTRHRVTLEFRGGEAIEAGECFIAFLPEHEFTIPGQLVADAAVVEVHHCLDPAVLTVTCELLLLEEG